MNDFVFTMACYAILVSVIVGAILGEIIKCYMYTRDYENRLIENRKRVWDNFVKMGN